MKVTELFEAKEVPSEVFDAALNDLIRTMKANNPAGSRNYSEWRDPGPRFYGRPGREASVRDWGTWENPPDARHEQDYDWQQPTKATVKALEKIIKDVQKRHKQVALSAAGSEKNWIELIAEPKQRKPKVNQPR